MLSKWPIRVKFLAGVGLLLAFFDDEPGAEVYAAATKRDQAKILWGEAKAMVQASPGLSSRIAVLANNLNQESTRSKFEPLSADYNSMDGLNPHGNMIDELHAHKTRDIWKVLDTATGARRQYLTFVITTAGFDRSTVCWEQHAYATQVLEGSVKDDSLFAYIATIDACSEHEAGGRDESCEQCDDWADPDNWAKANPNLGVSVKPEKLHEAAAKAKAVPAELNAFLQLHLDVWTTQSTRWLSDDLWMTCAGDVDPEALKGQGCFAALSLNSTVDLAALVLWFPEEKAVLLFSWCPWDVITERSRVDGVPYDTWVRDGLLGPTEGNVTDYPTIRNAVNELNLLYNIREVGVRRWNTTQLQTQLQDDGFEVKIVGDGYKDMGPGTKELERLLLAAEISHGANPVLRWAASNVAVRRDADENIRPDNEASTERIDPMMALVMAIGMSLYAEEEYAGVTFA